MAISDGSLRPPHLSMSRSGRTDHPTRFPSRQSSSSSTVCSRECSSWQAMWRRRHRRTGTDQRPSTRFTERRAFGGKRRPADRTARFTRGGRCRETERRVDLAADAAVDWRERRLRGVLSGDSTSRRPCIGPLDIRVTASLNRSRTSSSSGGSTVNEPKNVTGAVGRRWSRPRSCLYSSRKTSTSLFAAFVATPPWNWWNVASPSSRIGETARKLQARSHVSRFTKPPPGEQNDGSYPSSSLHNARTHEQRVGLTDLAVPGRTRGLVEDGDAEQVVAVVLPVDPIEQLVLERLVVPIPHASTLHHRAEVATPSADDGSRVRLQRRPGPPEQTRRRQPSSVDEHAHRCSAR